MILSFLWILTYILVLLGTKKYKYPLISPITQIFIASLEFSVLFQLIIEKALGWNHIGISYVCWTIVEILIIVAQIRYGFISKKYVGMYISLMAITTAIMCYFVAYKKFGFFFNYFNTFVGEIVWLLHIRKKDYPKKPIVLLIFITKFVADTIAISVYFGRGAWIISLISIALPILDFLFIHTYFSRIGNNTLKQPPKCFPKLRKEVMDENETKNKS